jgi:4-amino-4-deoxy-L-arabinose transferase-like glycosyltransferase
LADPSLLGWKNPSASQPFVPPLAGDVKDTQRLVDFLISNRHDEQILVASLESMSVSGIIIVTGETAVALGGFMGADPAVTKADFVKMVQNGRLRFMIIGGFPGGGPPRGQGRVALPPGAAPFPPGGPPGHAGNREVIAWVRENGKLVDAKLWQTPEELERAAQNKDSTGQTPPFDPRRRAELFDCRPELGLVNPTAR